MDGKSDGFSASLDRVRAYLSATDGTGYFFEERWCQDLLTVHTHGRLSFVDTRVERCKRKLGLLNDVNHINKLNLIHLTRLTISQFRITSRDADLSCVIS